MAKYVEVEEKDLQGLLEAVDHAIAKVEDWNPELCALLKEREQRLLGHLQNERLGSGIGSEVEAILTSISPKDVAE